MMNYTIRKLRPQEHNILRDFLYEAIYIPKGKILPDRSIIDKPELQIYYKDFTKPDDNALVLEVEGSIVGAVWTRIINDYGHIDNKTPSLAISLFKEYRGCGLGTKMMEQMLLLLRKKGYNQVSLSVNKENYAVKLYQHLGFKVIEKKDDEYIMVCKLN